MSKFFSHYTAVIDNGAKIGEGSKIWHFSHVSEKSSIGKSVTIGQNVFIGNNVLVGDGSKIQNNVSVYENVIIEEDVFCGPSMVFTNVMNPRAHIERKDQYLKTHIKKGATLGANCTIICGVTIGSYSFIGAGTVVNKDVLDFALCVGNPVRQIGWMSKYGEKLDFDDNVNSEAICKHTGEVYILENGRVAQKK